MNSVKNLSEKVEDGLTQVGLQDLNDSVDTIVAAKQVVHESR